MKKFIFLAVLLGVFFTATATQLVARPKAIQNDPPTIYEGVEGEVLNGYQSYVYTIWAGQNIEAGTLTVSNDDENIYLDIETYGMIDDVHVYIYDDIADLPTTRPAPGLAPYYLEEVYDHTAHLEIPIGELEDGDTFYLIVHIAFMAWEEETDETILMFADQTGYAAGEDEPEFNGRGAWFYVIGFTVKWVEEDDDDEPGDYDSETAWAYGGVYAQTFNDLGIDNKWGWVNGPLEEGTYEFELWAGAAQNDLSKGTHVGTVIVEYDGEEVTVTYELFEDFVLLQVHIYVGNDLPTTAAPGQLGFTVEDLNDDFFETTFDIDGLIYIAAHAVVYGPFEE